MLTSDVGGDAFNKNQLQVELQTRLYFCVLRGCGPSTAVHVASLQSKLLNYKWQFPLS